jgi:purine-binding chemotaxis protein CheW
MTAAMTTPLADTSRGGKYLTFALGAEEYGIEILRVREIVGSLDVTPVPRSPPHVKGVANLRGQVIPVIDLRSAFGMPAAAATAETCVVVLETRRDGRKVCCGAVVDRVREVLDVPADQVEDPPEFGAATSTAFVRGLAKVGQGVKILLDIDQVLAAAGRANG